MDNEFRAQVQAYLILWLIQILTIFKRSCRKFLPLLADRHASKKHAFHSRDFFWEGGGWVRTSSNFVLLIARTISAVEAENANL